MEAPISDIPSFAHFIQWAFYGVITLLGGTAVSALFGLKRSVEELNTNVAVVISRVDTHEKRLDRHEELLDIVREYHS